MNIKTLTAILFVIFTFHQSASAYSPIFTIDDWSAAQLKEAGITVATWKHDQIGEEPPKNWVKITYDTSKIGDQNVLMTLNVDAFNQDSTTSFRVERKKGEAAELSLIFAVEEKNAEDASIQIIAPQQLAKGADRPYGDPGFGGYSLPLSKIMKIACEAAANKPVEEVEKKSEDRQPALEEEKALKPTKAPSQDSQSEKNSTRPS